MTARWTYWADRRADRLFARLSEREIRRRQDLCAQQIVRAFNARHTRALRDLQRMDHALQRALLRRV